MMHIFWTLWYGYNWPSLKGNGPEAIDQTIVYAAIGLMLYPPLRKWSRRELKRCMLDWTRRTRSSTT